MTLAEIFREEGVLKGKEEGMREGIKEGEAKTLAKTAIRLLTKRFGRLTEETRAKIQKLDVVTLELIIDEIFEYKSLDDVKKYIQ